MNPILNSRFILLATQDNQSEVDEQVLVDSYNEFHNQLKEIVDNENHYPTIFRLLCELEAIFILRIEQLKGRSNSLKKICSEILY